MLFYLFSAEELRELLDSMGYSLPADTIPRTVDFYLGRTSNGSTLSRLVHSRVLARSDRHRSWSLFTQALDSDLADIQGGTTREGVHLGAMAGTVDLVLRCYAGLEIRDDVLRLHPSLPPEFPNAAFEIVYRGQPISVEVTRAQVRLRLHPHSGDSITVYLGPDECSLAGRRARGGPRARGTDRPQRPPDWSRVGQLHAMTIGVGAAVWGIRHALSPSVRRPGRPAR